MTATPTAGRVVAKQPTPTVGRVVAKQTTLTATPIDKQIKGT